MEKIKKILNKTFFNFPITLWGFIFLISCVASFWFIAVKQLDLVYFYISSIGILLFFTMLILVIIFYYLIKKNATPSNLPANLKLTVEIPQATGFSLPSFYWTPFITISWKWDFPEKIEIGYKNQKGRLYEKVVPLRRGVYDEIRRTIEVSDIFGFCRMRWKKTEKTNLHILPKYGKLQNLTALLSLFSGDDISHPYGAPEGDRIDMRQYSPGDSPRTIMWKIYARTRKLFVRIPERALTARPRIAAYVVSGNGDEPSAALARVVLEHRLLGQDWIFGADGSETYSSQLPQALQILSKSGNVYNSNSQNIKNFLKKSISYGCQHCLLFVPSLPGQWQKEAEVALNTKLNVHIVVVFDSKDKTKINGHTMTKMLFQKEYQKIVPSQDLKAVLERLPQKSGSVFMIDRATGKLYSQKRAYIKNAR